MWIITNDNRNAIKLEDIKRIYCNEIYTPDYEVSAYTIDAELYEPSDAPFDKRHIVLGTFTEEYNRRMAFTVLMDCIEKKFKLAYVMSEGVEDEEEIIE